MSSENEVLLDRIQALEYLKKHGYPRMTFASFSKGGGPLVAAKGGSDGRRNLYRREDLLAWAKEHHSQKPGIKNEIEAPFDADASRALALVFDGDRSWSTVEIAEMVNKRHDNVMQDFRKDFEKINEKGALKFQVSDFKGTYISKQGKTLPCYWLPFNLAVGLAARYDAAARQKIVDEWLAFKAATPSFVSAPLIDLRDPDQLIKLLLGYAHDKKVLQEKVVQANDRADKFEIDSVAYHLSKPSEGSMTVRDWVSSISENIGEKATNEWFIERGWIVRMKDVLRVQKDGTKRIRKGPRRASAAGRREGYFENVTEHNAYDVNGNPKDAVTVYITVKGQVKFERAIAKKKIAKAKNTPEIPLL